MIDRESIEEYITKSNYYTVTSVDQETSFYKVGAIDRGKYIRSKIYYLELYQFALNELLKFYDADLDYTEYGISDDDVNKYFRYIDEIIKVLFV